MTKPEFDVECAARGFKVLVPGRHDVEVYGFVDIGNGVRVNRWKGGNRLVDQFAYFVKVREELNKAKPKAAKKVAKKASKKAAKKVAKKGASK